MITFSLIAMFICGGGAYYSANEVVTHPKKSAERMGGWVYLILWLIPAIWVIGVNLGWGWAVYVRDF